LTERERTSTVAQPSTAPYETSARAPVFLPEIVELPVWKRLAGLAMECCDWLEQVQIELTQIPAPTFHESQRAAFVAEQFRELGLQNVRLDEVGNVLAERSGRIPRWFVITAHLDTVVPLGVPIEVRRSNGRLYAPGIADNGAGLAALLGAAAVLQKSSVATDLSLLFVANVGEEGEGDLYGMRHLLGQAETRRRIAGMLVLDGSSLDHITVAGLGSRRYLVEVTGPGGHSWKDFGRVNPIHALANAVAQLGRLSLPAEPRTTVNVGMIQGGTVVNAIPHSAWMKVDIRSTQSEEIDRCSRTLEAAVRASVEQENQRGVGTLQVRVLPIGERPAAEQPAGSRLLEVVREADRCLGIQSRLERSSTDANIPLSLGIEAVAIAGGGLGGDAHTPNEWYDPQGRDLGLKRILLTVLAMSGVVASSEAA
jgi:acetylornithine deacetylase/succinyl-diaminopimelate desuccinylase-like protein